MKFKGNRNILKFILFTFLFCTLYSGNILGQVQADLVEPELLMGHLGDLNIKIKLKNDSSNVKFPLLDEAISKKQKYVGLLDDTIELQVSNKHNIEQIGKDIFLNYNLKIQAFDSGKYVLPPFEFIVDGLPQKSNEVTLNIIPVKVKADDQLDPFADIAEPFEINPGGEEDLYKEGTSLLWWILVIVIAMIVVSLLLYIRYKKTGKLFIIKEIPEYEQAIKKLNKLKDQKLPEKGKTKEYYTKLTDILRRYLHKEFGIRTVEKTSQEILEEVSKEDTISNYKDVLRTLFETSDFVKFAKVNPSETENQRCMEESLKFILSSHRDMVNSQEKGGTV